MYGRLEKKDEPWYADFYHVCFRNGAIFIRKKERLHHFIYVPARDFDRVMTFMELDLEDGFSEMPDLGDVLVMCLMEDEVHQDGYAGGMFPFNSADQIEEWENKGFPVERLAFAAVTNVTSTEVSFKHFELIASGVEALEELVFADLEESDFMDISAIDEELREFFDVNERAEIVINRRFVRR